MKKTILKVNGMSCAMCAKTIENTLGIYDSIKAKVNVSAGKVIINYDESKHTIKEIAQMITEAGYEPVLDTTIDNQKGFVKRLRTDIIVSVIFSLPLLYAMFSHIAWFDFLPVPSLFKDGIFQLVISGIVQFYIGRRFYKAAYHSLRKKVLGMDLLVVLGTTSAYLYSLYLLYIQLFVNPVHHPVYYFEISALIISMVLIGNYIEHLAKERTTDALVALMNLGAKEARVIRNGEEALISIDEVEVGDQIVVLANEKIPVDGIVVSGRTFIDESMITGESIPVQKEKNSEVIGSTINIQEKIIIEAKKVGSETLLAQIIQTVEEAASDKPPIQRTADKIAAYFVPIVVSIALLNFIIQFLILGVMFEPAFTRSIAILVISCPCALGLATPTSILVGNGKAAQNHILYRGGEFFELANKIQVIAFDKTGTLTEGKPQVTDFVGDTDVLKYAYALEKESTHPISQAFKLYAKDHIGDMIEMDVTDFKTHQGKGIEAMIDGQTVLVGSIKIVNEIKSDNPFEMEYQKLLNEAKTINFIIINQTVKALYAVRDEIKPTSKVVIDEMKRRGLIPYMITGDNKQVAKAIASELGIENYYSEVYPHEKANIIKDIQQKGYMTAFVGDGINDAPALKVADVGFAMGHGTDIAIDSSDVTLMSHDLGLVLKAIDMSKATLKNIYQNFGWAFSYNLIAIPLAATGRLSMVLAAAAMAFSSITVVLNALRLKRVKLQNFEKGEYTMKLTVLNMSCQHCEASIKKTLGEMGITDVSVNLDTKVVEFDPNNHTFDEVKAAIEATGYDVL